MENDSVSSDPLIILLQISDSVFPTGGFSHSLGLESSLRRNVVKNTQELREFIYCSIENTGSLNLPFVAAAHRECRDSCNLGNLDKLCQACTTNHVANRASVRQGRSMLETSCRAFRMQELSDLTQKLPHSHHPIVFGCVCCIMGVDVRACLTAYMYNTLKNVVAAAVRLDKIGPLEAQEIQTDIQSHIPDIIERYKDQSVEKAHVVYPVLDIVQNTHDTMFSKLFYS